MKYDFLEQIEVESVREDNVVYGADAMAAPVGKSRKKRKINLFNLVVAQLAVCILVGLTFIALQLWTDVQVSRIGDIIVEAFNGANSLYFGL